MVQAVVAQELLAMVVMLQQELLVQAVLVAVVAVEVVLETNLAAQEYFTFSTRRTL
jgi:hypothetical protein